MDAMKWTAWIVLAIACQQGRGGTPEKAEGSSTIIQLPKAAVTADYVQDITNLCDVMKLSGADQLPPGDRLPTIAMWLGPHIKTDAAREFLAAIQPLSGEPKTVALEHEAQRVGLEHCALAAEWK
jgi:hypothetical protein